MGLPSHAQGALERGLSRALGTLLVLAVLPLACGSEGRKSTARGSEGGGAGEGGAAVLEAAGGHETETAGAAPEGGAGPGPAIALSEYCRRISESYTDFLVRCYGSTDYPESERDGFTAARMERCLEVAPSLEAERLSFDGVAAAACLAELEADDTCSPFDHLMRAPACSAALFIAQVEPGGECFRDATLHFSVLGAASECQGGFCDGDQCPGICHEWLADGEACDTGQCSPDSACIDGECAPRRAEEEDCPQEDACAVGLACVGNVCRVPSQAGDPCYGGLCSTGYNCIEDQCRAKVEVGEICTWRYDCADDGRCLDRDGDGPQGLTCGPLGELGEWCSQPVDCGPDFYCEREGAQMMGICQSRSPISTPCTRDSCEVGAWCNHVAGFCQAEGDEGDDCLLGAMPGPNQACAGELQCMSDGKCHPVGDVGDPCHVRALVSCAEGTFCSRDGAVCAPLGRLGDYCNPFLRQSCEGDLGCICSGDDCGATPPTNEHDTLFTCAPRRQLGEECFAEHECAGDDFCGAAGTCEAGSFCLP